VILGYITFLRQDLNFSTHRLAITDLGKISLKVSTLFSRKYEPLFSVIRDYCPSSIVYSRIVILDCIMLSLQDLNSSIHRPRWVIDRVDEWPHYYRDVQPRDRACRYPMIRHRLTNSSPSSSLQMRITSRLEFTHYSTAGSATRLNSVLRLAKYEADLSISIVIWKSSKLIRIQTCIFSPFHDIFRIQDPPPKIWKLENNVFTSFYWKNSSVQYFLLSYKLQ